MRRKARQLRRDLTPAFRKQANTEILQKLRGLEVYREARTIHTYVSWQDEVATQDLLRMMLQEGKSVVTPKVISASHQLEHYLLPNFEALMPGAFGILEPSRDHGALPFTAMNKIDLLLVPGLAFDREGNRLGYGGGYYDRLLAELAAPKVALAFAAQIVASVPAEAHDERVDCIVTEEEVISCAAE